MGTPENLYQIVVDGASPISDQVQAMSKLTTMRLTGDVIEVLSKIAKDTNLSTRIRQMASDCLFKK
jgi:hypothetical protein